MVSIKDAHRSIIYKTESNLRGPRAEKPSIRVRPHVSESPHSLLSIYHVSGAVLRTEDTVLNTTGQVLAVLEQKY